MSIIFYVVGQKEAKRRWRKQGEEESIKVSVKREDALCRSQ